MRLNTFFQVAIHVIFLILLNLTLHAAQLKTLSMDFTREITENGETEKSEGTLHYNAVDLRVVVEVKEPIKQIMITKDKILEIYYPNQKKAFRFISDGQIPLPLIESILQATQAEYGLTALLGYTLDRHEVVDKVLYTYWKPPEKSKDKLGPVILGMLEDKLISAEVKNPKEHIVAKTLYKKHHKLGNSYIPMEVLSLKYGEQSEVIQMEKITYRKPQVNEETLNPILNFTIPESVEVKEIKW